MFIYQIRKTENQKSKKLIFQLKKINLLDLLNVIRKPKTSRTERKRKQGKGKDGNKILTL